MFRRSLPFTIVFGLVFLGTNRFAGISSSAYRESAADTYIFEEIGELKSARYEHTAEFLPDSRVLFIGGFATFSSDATPDSEIYDPATGGLTYSDHLYYNRQWHSSMALQNGRILVTGGGHKTAEEYNPMTGEFYPVGAMSNLLFEHPSVRLQEGTVLILGGSGNANIFSDVESYNPYTGTFTMVGKLNEKRNGHTATQLSDGRILITGGAGNDISRTAEIYDPATNASTYTGMMTENRFIHTATLLLDGTVLIVGGSNGRNVPDDILDSAEVYDPKTGAFMKVGNLNHKRMRHTATLLPSGKVLILAGEDRNTFLATAEVYDPLTQQFRVVGSLARARWGFTATLLKDDTVLVAGGVVKDPDGIPFPNEITNSIELITLPELKRIYLPSTLGSGN